MREVRLTERKEWIKELRESKSPDVAARHIKSTMFNGPFFRNTMREKELIPNFQPKHSDSLVKELR